MKNLLDIAIGDVKKILQNKGFKIFLNGEPNIIGIRSNVNDEADTYNDRCWVWWIDNGTEIIHTYSITTHPGFYYLKKPISGTSGTAILVPGQYLNCWELGMHRGKQFALCQHCGPVKVFRDNNRDTLLNCDRATIETGYFGIDLHHGSIDDKDVIGAYSAGCQVWRFGEAHQKLMSDFKVLSTKSNFAKFSYTLLEQTDFQ